MEKVIEYIKNPMMEQKQDIFMKEIRYQQNLIQTEIMQITAQKKQKIYME